MEEAAQKGTVGSHMAGAGPQIYLEILDLLLGARGRKLGAGTG